MSDLNKLRDEEARRFTDEASGELFSLQKHTGVGWGSDEAVCFIIEGSFQAGWDARDKIESEALKVALEALHKIGDRQLEQIAGMYEMIAEDALEKLKDLGAV